MDFGSMVPHKILGKSGWGRSGWAVVSIVVAGAWLAMPLHAMPLQSANPSQVKPVVAGAIAEASDFIRPAQDCPSDLETLVPLLLRDLPSYTNRVVQRSFRPSQLSDRPGVVIIAGQPDYAPLSLGPGLYTPSDGEDEPRQIFFTTLERQYVSGVGVRLQEYHWLFLTYSQDRWRLALMFSSTGDYPADSPSSPPEDSSQGAIAQAIRLWLRDCAAHAVESSG